MRRTEEYKPPAGYVTSKEASERLNCTREYLYKLRDNGKLKMFKKMGYVLFLETQIKEMERPKRID
jgi:excisionase family DNA binding protein